MKVENFVNIIGADFYTGVPDSQLKALCNYLIDKYGIDPHHHVIAANEGNCTALAAGYHLATGKTPVVYMQNSGEGNIINPVASLSTTRSTRSRSSSSSDGAANPASTMSPSTSIRAR